MTAYRTTDFLPDFGRQQRHPVVHFGTKGNRPTVGGCFYARVLQALAREKESDFRLLCRRIALACPVRFAQHPSQLLNGLGHNSAPVGIEPPARLQGESGRGKAEIRPCIDEFRRLVKTRIKSSGGLCGNRKCPWSALATAGFRFQWFGRHTVQAKMDIRSANHKRTNSGPTFGLTFRPSFRARTYEEGRLFEAEGGVRSIEMRRGRGDSVVNRKS